MNDTERRIETLRLAISAAKMFLSCVPKGGDPNGEAQLAKDQDELDCLLREVQKGRAA
jgi:hypothetical protein